MKKNTALLERIQIANPFHIGRIGFFQLERFYPFYLQGSPAAIDHQLCTRHKARFVGRQIEGSIRNIFRLTEIRELGVRLIIRNRASFLHRRQPIWTGRAGHLWLPYTDWSRP